MDGKKVTPGISSFHSHPNDVAAYMAPVLVHAASLIPAKYHNITHVYIKATAGQSCYSLYLVKLLIDAVFNFCNRYAASISYSTRRNMASTCPWFENGSYSTFHNIKR